MKTFLFGLLFTALTFGQGMIRVVGDTTDLKATHGAGIVILDRYGGGNDAGGGLFHRIDSTYAEGTHAFDNVSTGLQWARVSMLEGTVTLQNNETITNATDGQISFGSANLYTTGTLTAGSTTFGGGSLTSTLNADSNNIEYVDTLTGANAETISNSVNGQWSFGSANLLTTGTLGAGATTVTTLSGTTITGSGFKQSAYATITNQNVTNTADSDTLALGSELSNLIKVRSVTSNSDSVVYLTGGVSNSYYQFKPVHTDTTITFADGINSNLILGASRVLDGDDDLLILFFDGTKWIEVAFANNE